MTYCVQILVLKKSRKDTRRQQKQRHEAVLEGQQQRQQRKPEARGGYIQVEQPAERPHQERERQQEHGGQGDGFVEDEQREVLPRHTLEEVVTHHRVQEANNPYANHPVPAPVLLH